jgi:hypothetical protein
MAVMSIKSPDLNINSMKTLEFPNHKSRHSGTVTGTDLRPATESRITAKSEKAGAAELFGAMESGNIGVISTEDEDIGQPDRQLYENMTWFE